MNVLFSSTLEACPCRALIKKEIKWFWLTSADRKILLSKRYFTWRTAFGSHHYQKEQEQNQKGHRSTIIHKGASVWRWIRFIWFGGEEVWRYRNHKWDREGWTGGDPWHPPNSTLISRCSVKWNGNHIKTEKVLYIVFMHILLVKLTTNKYHWGNKPGKKHFFFCMAVARLAWYSPTWHVWYVPVKF